MSWCGKVTQIFPFGGWQPRVLTWLDTKASCKEKWWHAAGCGWVKSIKHSTYIFFVITVSTNLQIKTNEKGIPLFLVLRRGYNRQGRERAWSQVDWFLCSVRSHLLQPSPSICLFLHSTVPISNVQLVPVWGPGWAAAWWGVRPSEERLSEASPSIAPAGWAQPARSWTESQFSCSHGCSPHHHGCTCSQPWKKVRESYFIYSISLHSNINRALGFKLCYLLGKQQHSESRLAQASLLVVYSTGKCASWFSTDQLIWVLHCSLHR